MPFVGLAVPPGAPEPVSPHSAGLPRPFRASPAAHSRRARASRRRARLADRVPVGPDRGLWVMDGGGGVLRATRVGVLAGCALAVATARLPLPGCGILTRWMQAANCPGGTADATDGVSSSSSSACSSSPGCGWWARSEGGSGSNPVGQTPSRQRSLRSKLAVRRRRSLAIRGQMGV